MKKLFYLLLLVPLVSFSQTAEGHFNNGLAKYHLTDYYGAIEDFTKAIKVNPNDADTYYNRGVAKSSLGDIKGAIADFTKAIKINPNYDYAYYNRGLAKYPLGDKNGSCQDARKAQQLGHKTATQFINEECK
jgi:tetratricopeptide (TPR) repeat protein